MLFGNILFCSWNQLANSAEHDYKSDDKEENKGEAFKPYGQWIIGEDIVRTWKSEIIDIIKKKNFGVC